MDFETLDERMSKVPAKAIIWLFLDFETIDPYPDKLAHKWAEALYPFKLGDIDF